MSTRRKRNQSEDGNPAPLKKIGWLPVVDPPPEDVRKEQGRPFCTNYGKDRKNRPGWKGVYHFCSKCDEVDLEESLGTSVDRSKKKYQCTALHTNWSHPTQSIKGAARVHRGCRGKGCEDTPNASSNVYPQPSFSELRIYQLMGGADAESTLKCFNIVESEWKHKDDKITFKTISNLSKNPKVTMYLAYPMAGADDTSEVDDLAGILCLERKDGRRPDDFALTISLMWTRISHRRCNIMQNTMHAAIKHINNGNVVLMSSNYPKEGSIGFYQKFDFIGNSGSHCYATTAERLEQRLDVNLTSTGWMAAVPGNDGAVARYQKTQPIATAPPAPVPAPSASASSKVPPPPRSLPVATPRPPKTSRVHRYHQALVEIERLNSEKELLKKQLEEARKERDKHRKQVWHLKQKKASADAKLDELSRRPESLRDGLESVIAYYVQKFYPTTKAKKRATEIAAAAWKCLGGVARDGIRKLVVDELKKNAYAAWLLLKEMDLGDGNVNNAAVKLMRKLGAKAGKLYGGIFPSEYEMTETRKKLEALGNRICPVIPVPTSMGEGVQFKNIKQMGVLLLRGFGLLDIGKTRPLTVGVASDGTKLTNHLNLMICGVKMIDEACQNDLIPMGKMKGGELKLNLQCRDRCFPTMMLLSKETNEVYQLLKPHYDVWTAAAQANTEVLGGYALGFEEQQLKPINCEINCDLSGDWKGLGKGCGAKKSEESRFCTRCAIKSRDIAKPREKQCPKCEQGPTNRYPHLISEWGCYHYTETKEDVERKIKDVEDVIRDDLDDTRKYLDEIQSRSKIKSHQDETDAITKMDSLDFLPRTTDEELDFIDFLSDEATIRNIDVSDMNREEMTQILKEQKEAEETLEEELAKITHLREVPGALYLASQVSPCILHGTRRVNIKMLSVLLNEGLSNAIGGKLFPDEKSKKKRIDIYIKMVEEIFNHQLLGTEKAPGHFSLRYENDARDSIPKIPDPNMEADRIKKVMKAVDPLIDAVIIEKTGDDDHRRERWKACLFEWNKATSILHKEDVEYTRAELEGYWDYISHWALLWVSLTGYGGQTNYTHIYVGHVPQIMEVKGCLYQYSQQGWEALNKLVRSWFFRRTNRGGGRGERSKLMPLGKLLQRRLIWLTGLGDLLFTGRLDEEEVAALEAMEPPEGSSLSAGPGPAAETNEEEEDVHDAYEIL